jgi:hypothetical protein
LNVRREVIHLGPRHCVTVCNTSWVRECYLAPSPQREGSPSVNMSYIWWALSKSWPEHWLSWLLFLWFFVPSGRSQGASSIRPLPPKSFPVHQSLYHSVLYGLDTYHCKINRKYTQWNLCIFCAAVTRNMTYWCALLTQFLSVPKLYTTSKQLLEEAFLSGFRHVMGKEHPSHHFCRA